MTSAVYFITGTTGFLGGEILRTILAENPNAQCYCLIRKGAENRLPLASNQVVWVTGDVTLDHLGMNDDEYFNLSKKITHIIHSAAVVQFEKPLAFLEKINVGGARNMLAFAKVCQQNNPDFKVMGHVSTAYVAGKRKGVVREEDLSNASGFKNNYEATKFAAEKLIREEKQNLPVIIFRPSIILGHSQDGRTLDTNVLFPTIQLIKRFKFKVVTVPANKGCLMDLVPVDFVAQSIYFLVNSSDAIGHTYHLTCGQGNELSIDRLSMIMANYYHKKAWIIPYWFWPVFKKLLSLHKRGKYFVKGMDPFWLYTIDNPQFCQSATQKVLDQFDLRCGSTEDVLKKTVAYIEN